MKKLLLILVLFYSLTGVLFGAGKKDAQKQPQNNTFKIDAPYYTGDGCKDFRLAVVPLKTSGQELSENERWYPEFIQGILTNDFTRFSAMSIIDRIYLETVLDEQKLSLSGDFSEDDYIKIGNITNAQYILTGSLIKISSVRYRLQLAVINAEKGTRFKSYDAECTKTDIINANAIKRASEDLLVQIGVNLTENGKAALRGASIEADTSIARGITAQRSGNDIETLNYFYSAVEFDPSSREAAKRLSAVKEDISENKAGAVLRNDIKSQNLWAKTLKEYTDFYSEHLPFEIVFTQYASQLSADYANKTYVLQAQAGLRRTSSIDTMQNVLNNINDGLKKSQRSDVWGFTGWPKNENLFNESKYFNIEIEILGAHGDSLTNGAFQLEGGISIYSNEIYAQTMQSYTVVFPTISYNDADEIPDNFVVRIVSVNGEDAESVSERGYLKISPAAVFPAEQRLTSAAKAAAKQRDWVRLASSWGNFWSDYKIFPDYIGFGYIYEPDYPLGFRFELSGFYTTWNFYLPNWQGYDAPSLFDTAEKYDENGKIHNSSGYNSYKDYKDLLEREHQSFEWIVGTNINVINKILILTAGAGARHSLERGLFGAEHDQPKWFAKGKPKVYKEADWETDFLLEAGAEMRLFNWLSLFGTYRLINLKENSFTIGAGLSGWW